MTNSDKALDCQTCEVISLPFETGGASVEIALIAMEGALLCLHAFRSDRTIARTTRGGGRPFEKSSRVPL